MKARAALCYVSVTAVGCAALLATWHRHRTQHEVRPRPRRVRTGPIRLDQLAAIAHELRTPLNSIVNWVGILQSGRADASQTATALRSIASSARTQGRLIEDLLDSARSDTNQMSLRMRVIDARLPIASAVDVIRPAADAAGLSLSMALPAQPCMICGDVERLQQAFGNLLSNAVKFTPRGGIRVIAVECGSSVDVQIADTGKGIEQDFLPHVFEQFQQAHQSTRRQSGLGLGLAICRDLIMRHDGTVDVVSDGPGRGTTVTVRLPLIGDTSTVSGDAA